MKVFTVADCPEAPELRGHVHGTMWLTSFTTKSEAIAVVEQHRKYNFKRAGDLESYSPLVWGAVVSGLIAWDNFYRVQYAITETTLNV